jgi:hypothetical protein
METVSERKINPMRLDKILVALLSIGLVCGLPVSLMAQQTPGLVTPQAVGGQAITTCGTAPVTITAGILVPLLLDTNGGLCVGAVSLATGAKVEVVDGSNNVLPTTASGPVVPTSADGVVVSYEALTSGGITTAMTATTSTVVVPATAAQYIYIDHCTVSNASTTVSTDISLQDGSGGTIIWNIPAPAAAVATTGGSGADVTWPNHPLRVPTAGNGLFAANVTTGSSTKIFCSGFKSAIAY